MQTCFPGWDVELIQLGPRRLTGWTSITLLPLLRIVRLHVGRSVVIRGTASAVDDLLMLSLSHSAPVRWLGQALDANRFVVTGRRARVDIFMPGGATLCVVTGGLFGGLAPKRIQMRTASDEDVSRLLRCVDSAAEIHSPRGARFQADTIEETFARELDAIMETSTLAAHGTGPRNLRAAAVERACAFIDSQLPKPLSLADLSRHCGVAVRTLEYGFREFYDTTPMAFIKSQRLTRTHHALTQERTPVVSISKVARRLGFTHMGQYAQDYRGLFSESPSMTLQRTLRRDNDELHGDAKSDPRPLP